jgi:D-glycero-D-manno-heptose 1,7-bisphosphate phosphatase
MKKLRIAQITDIHLRKNIPGSCALPDRHSRRMPELLPLVLNEIKKLNTDFIAVTGDLVDVPLHVTTPVPGFSQDSPSFWRKAAYKDYKLIKSILDSQPLPYMVLHGNHDLDSLFWKVFDKSKNMITVNGCEIIRFCDYEHTCNIPRRFFPEKVRWEEALKTSGAGPQIHLQHYVISPPIIHSYPHNYRESDYLMNRMNESKKQILSLSGHYHPGVGMIKKGNCWFSVCPALCHRPFPFRVYDVSINSVQCKEYSLEKQGNSKKKAFFLDRDGVVSKLPSYHRGPEAMELLPGTAKAIRLLNKTGYAVIVVSNQRCIGRGYVPEDIVHAVNDKMCRLLAEDKAFVDAVYFSKTEDKHPVLPEYSKDTESKPSPMLLHKAIHEYNLTIEGSYMIGDRWDDLEAGINTGVKPVLVRTGYGRETEGIYRERFKKVPVYDDLLKAIEDLLK